MNLSSMCSPDVGWLNCQDLHASVRVLGWSSHGDLHVCLPTLQVEKEKKKTLFLVHFSLDGSSRDADERLKLYRKVQL